MQHAIDEIDRMDEVEETRAPRRRSSDATHASRRRLLYFCFATLWGYVLGIGVLAAALSRADVRVRPDLSLLVWVVSGTLVCVVGALVVAGAYRESRRRHR